MLPRRSRWSYAAVVTLGLLFGCTGPSPGMIPATSMDAASTSDAAGAGPGGGSDAAPNAVGYPAAHASLPRVETLGGPVLTRPTVVPVFFANDQFQPQIEQFLTQLAESSYWAATTLEYGVGPLKVAPSIVVADDVPSSITNPQVSSWFAGYLDGTHQEWPAIDGQNIYVVFYPQETTIVLTNGTTSCSSFGGFHAEGSASLPVGGGDGGTEADAASDDAAAGNPGAAGGLPFPYAVIPRCATFNTLTGIDSLTAALSHELIEAATNPFARTNRGYSLVDVDHVAWALGLGGQLFVEEVGDLCESESPGRAFQRLVGTFMVQRTWSNQAAAANQDPCVPAIPEAYFGAAPEFDHLDDIVNDGGVPNLLLTTGARLAVGQSKTISVRLFSTAPIPDWYVSVRQLLGTAGAPTTLRTALDRSTGNNGDILKLTITRIADGPTSGGTVIYLASSTTPLTANTVPAPYTRWYGFVQN